LPGDEAECDELKGDPGADASATHRDTRGDIMFYEEITGAINPPGIGSWLGPVVIDPPDGKYESRFRSLHRMLAWPSCQSFPCARAAIGSAPPRRIEECHRASHDAGRMKKDSADRQAGAVAYSSGDRRKPQND